MSRLVAVPDRGDSGALHQWISIPEPGDDGYPMAQLPDGDPWATAVNRAIADIEAQTSLPDMPVACRAEYLTWEPEAEA
jgi:hypothetical protein